MEIIFSEAARRDVRKAYDWYENLQTGLGKKFLNEVLLFSNKLIRDDIGYRKWISGTHYITLKKFPFLIFFLKVENKFVSIVAVLHKRQDIVKRLNERK